MPVTTSHDPLTLITTVTVSPGYERPEYEDALESLFLTQDTRRVLADHTAEGPVWGTEDLEGHLRFLLDIRHSIPSGARVAILCSQVLDFGIARMMQMLTEGALPCHTRIFMCREEALQWLRAPGVEAGSV